MIALRRDGEGRRYASSPFFVSLEEVARKEKNLPAEFIAGNGCDVTPKFLEYASPLVGEVKPFPRLRE
jgi:hypothetical protein